MVIAGSLTATDASGVGPGTINITGGGDSMLQLRGNQTLDNVAINLNGSGFGTQAELQSVGNKAVLTLGSNAVVTSDALNATADIRGAGADQTAVVNEGTIVASATHDASHLSTFNITPFNGFTNQGTIVVSNGDLLSIQPGFGIFDNSGLVTVGSGSELQIESSAVTPPVSNTGSIEIDSGATLDLAGFYTPASLGDLSNQGTTQIDGTFDDGGGTLTLGPATLLNAVLLAGQIRNATIVPNGSLTIVGVNASLQNDVYEAPLSVASANTNLTIFQGVTLTDATGMLAGSLSVTGVNDTLNFANEFPANNGQGQAFDNVTLNVGNATSADVITAGFSGGTFTVGSKASIVSSTAGALASLNLGSSTTMVLDGTVTALGSGGTFTISGVSGGFASTFNNNGTINVGNTDLLNVLTPIVAGSGNGTIEVSGGAVANFASAVASDQTFLFNDSAGMLTLQQAGSFAAEIGGFQVGRHDRARRHQRRFDAVERGCAGQPDNLQRRYRGGDAVAAGQLLRRHVRDQQFWRQRLRHRHRHVLRARHTHPDAAWRGCRRTAAPKRLRANDIRAVAADTLDRPSARRLPQPSEPPTRAAGARCGACIRAGAPEA